MDTKLKRSRSESSSIDKERKKKKKKHQESFDESDIEEGRRTAQKKKKKKKKSSKECSHLEQEKLSNKKKKKKKQKKKVKEEDKEKVGCSPHNPVRSEDQHADKPQSKKKSMVPMTKEEYERQQSIVRRVYDPETGRHRLVKGDGEIIEEIVSKARHKEINKMSTEQDGRSFASSLGILK